MNPEAVVLGEDARVKKLSQKIDKQMSGALKVFRIKAYRSLVMRWKHW